MNELFLDVVNRSISASWLILAVLALRLVFRRGPKWIHVLLWGLVAVRMVCPFSIESDLSLVPSTRTIPDAVLSGTSFDIQTGIPPVDAQVNGYLADHYFEGVTVPAYFGLNVVNALTVIWLLGIAALAVHTVYSYLRFRRGVDSAVLLRENIYQSEHVTTPFVLGLVRPRIYVPFSLEEHHLRYVLAHEKAHIRRGDHWWKPLGFLLLTVHWFNPLMWAAYVLLCRDIEMACDEKVVGGLERLQRADYSRALLMCSVDRRMIAACPLAFGEVRVKERVKSVLNYRKPAFRVVALAVAACAVFAVCFLTDPATVSSGDFELAFDGLDLSQNPGVGYELIYEDEDKIIFYGDFGLFGYDLEQGKITLQVDFVKAFGKTGLVQGEYGTYAEVSADGNTVVFVYTDPEDPETVHDAWYIDIPTMTCRTGPFQSLGEVFQREDAQGVVIPGGTIGGSVYVRGEEQWRVFDGFVPGA